ncbi:uncharacterized protein [Miscanthus floridulus]|uniref:uncharacterized protein n=1 Tax=Miscanthus floridulus TaxID=154761 RepID=UPI00345A4004
MPTSPLKRPSGGGGRLGRLLASLRPPARAGPLPVQTGFPTSLADIVVKNHGRLRNPRRRHRAPGAVVPPAAAAAETQQRPELSVDHDVAAAAAAAAAGAGAPVPTGPGKGAGFSIRPGLLAAGGAVALALLVIWSKQLVAAATLASVALSWIESARTMRARRPETKKEVDSRRGRGCVSPIREAAESPRPCECESDNGGSDAADADSSDLGCDDSSSSVNNPKRKQSRRSLRKLLANKLRNGMTPRGKDCRHEQPGAGESNAEPAAAADAAPAEGTPAAPPEATTVTDDGERWHCQRGAALPLPALVPIILAGLVAGKLPALALAVLYAAFSSSVERVPAGQASR